MASTKQRNKPAASKSERNVLLNLISRAPISEEVLDANSNDVLDAVTKHAADIALGPAISLNVPGGTIRLRFDALVDTDAKAYKTIAEVLEVIEKHTDLRFESSTSEVDSPDEAETGEFAHC
jgi:hypothetical protein